MKENGIGHQITVILQYKEAINLPLVKFDLHCLNNSLPLKEFSIIIHICCQLKASGLWRVKSHGLIVLYEPE